MNTVPSEEQSLREALRAGYARLTQLGLNVGSAGNISARFDGGMLVSPTGADAATLTAEQLVGLELDGVPRGPGIPSSEWSMHAAIYRHYPQAVAVVHTHSDACVALACRRLPLPAFHYMVAGFGGDDVRCAAYATFGTAALADAAVEALRERTACLLANHGMICHGRGVEQAVATAIKLETLARQYWMTLHVGEAVILDANEMARVRSRYADYGKKRLAQA